MGVIRLWLVVAGILEALRDLGHGGLINDRVRRVEKAAGFEDSALPIVNLEAPPDLDVSTEAGRNVVLERAEEQRLPPAVRERRVAERAEAERARDKAGIPNQLKVKANDPPPVDPATLRAEILAELKREFGNALGNLRAEILAELKNPPPAPPAPPA